MLQNKVVVITGGAGLIGKAFVRAILESGGTAIIADVNTERSESMQQALTGDDNNNKLDVVEVDITSKSSLMACIEYVNDKYGRIDALVNNAYPRNTQYGKHFFDVEYDDFVENVGFNLGGYTLASQCFAQYFKNQGHGNIVNIASIYGVIAPKFDVYHETSMTVPIEYAAIKAGLIHLTKYMANYFKGMNIRVNTISPGGILDSQPEVFLENYKAECISKGMLDAKDLTGTLIYLLSDMSQYVNGQNIIVDDGFTL
jgi:NAD(P)-dependent dehydrogenase (short-subunit alcohol dehydrogenase family)